MIKNNIDALLEKNNKTRYWLAKEINLAYPNLVKLANNETSSIKLELLEKLSLALNCTLDELFTIRNNINED
jgi:putative transcriptional regulator